jgi:quercetin dioxygenase-like cupin family protein
MKMFAVTLMSLLVLAAAVAVDSQAPAASGPTAHSTYSREDSQMISITPNGSQPSSKGPAEYFTGAVRVDYLFQPQDPARASGAYVTFEPGARTAWHAHPLGQTLIVTSGCGLVQSWGGPIEKIRPGDVVRIPPGVKHWHGATATTAITHIAIQEHLEGKAADWLEKVSEEDYGKQP